MKVNAEDLTLESGERMETWSLALVCQDKFQQLEEKFAKISQEIVDLRTEKVSVADVQPKWELECMKLEEKLEARENKELKDQSQSLAVEYQVKIRALEEKVAKLSQDNVDLGIEKTIVTEDLVQKRAEADQFAQELMKKRLECFQLAHELMQKRLESEQLADELRRNNLEAIKTESGFRLKALGSSVYGMTSAVARVVPNVQHFISVGEKDCCKDGGDALRSLVQPNRGGSNSVGQSTGAIPSGSRVHLESYKVVQDDRLKGPQNSAGTGMNTELKVDNDSETELSSLAAAPVNHPNPGDREVKQTANRKPSPPSRSSEALSVRAEVDEYNVDRGKLHKLIMDRSSTSSSKKRVIKSDVWQHYSYDFGIEDDGTKKEWANCKYCTKVYKAGSNADTSTLRTHYQKKHCSSIPSGGIQPQLQFDGSAWGRETTIPHQVQESEE